MPGMKWPHQTKPRDVGRIVDEQIRHWTLTQNEPTSRQGGRQGGVGARQDDASTPEHKRGGVDRLGFHYWGDAITAELMRLMHVDERSPAYLNEGLHEAPSSQGTEDRTEQARADSPRLGGARGSA